MAEFLKMREKLRVRRKRMRFQNEISSYRSKGYTNPLPSFIAWLPHGVSPTNGSPWCYHASGCLFVNWGSHVNALSFKFEGWHEVKSLTLPPLTALYWISITGRVCWAHYLHPYLSCVYLFISGLFVILWALTEFLLAAPTLLLLLLDLGHWICFFISSNY